LNVQKPKSFWDEAAARACAQSSGPARSSDAEAARKPLRREPPPSAEPLAATDDQLRLRLAEELDYARRMLDAMGEELASDTALVMRHTAALQSVDIVGQMIGHVAAVVRCSTPDEAVERIGMAELKSRLKRRSVL
jgi:hypothetical protein